MSANIIRTRAGRYQRAQLNVPTPLSSKRKSADLAVEPIYRAGDARMPRTEDDITWPNDS